MILVDKKRENGGYGAIIILWCERDTGVIGIQIQSIRVFQNTFFFGERERQGGSDLPSGYPSPHTLVY